MMTQRLTMNQLAAMQADQLGFVQKATQEQGPVAHYKAMWMEMFFISSPEVIRECLVKHPDKMHRDPFVAGLLRRVLGGGVFLAEGEQWKRQRQQIQPAFHALRIREYAAVMQQYTAEMTAGWTAGQVVNASEMLTQLTLRIIAKTMYGVDLAGQTAELGRLIQTLFALVENQLGRPFNLPLWIPTRENRQQVAIVRQVRELLRGIIHQRQAEGVDKGDLLSMLLQARDEAGNPMPEELLLDECLTLFNAGHETTAAALTWCLALLTQHPPVLARLMAELEQVLGGQPIQFEQIAQLPYLDAVLKETLRLYPPAYAFGRQVQQPFQVGEYTFPKKAILLFSVFATHHSPLYYDQPEAFRPERFLDEATKPDRYTYLPFGAGPRICVGNMFALMEAAVVLATILQNVTLTRADDQPVEVDTVFTLRPKYPLNLRVG